MSNEHLSAERLQAFLESDLPVRDVDSIEEHLAGCARCSAELDAWRILFEDLGELSSHRPIEGFSDRVMSAVSMPEPLPLAARLRGRVASNAPVGSSHVSPEVIQDFLDGSLAARRAEKIEEHLIGCEPCTTEADAWIGMFQRLEGLESFTPAHGFSDQVMASVELHEPFASRVRSRVAALVRAPTPEHVPDGILQDFVEGILPKRTVAVVEAHVAACTSCAHEVQEWQSVAAQLSTMDSFAPTQGFAERVMAGYRVEQLVLAAAPVPVRSRSATRLRRLIPDARQALAALSGVAVTPAAIVGVLAYAVFSHPTLTVGSLVSFAWWQVADMAAAAVSGVSSLLLPGGTQSLMQVMASSPMAVGTGVLLYSMVSALALRVLYKNLYANRPADGRYAYVTTAS